MHPWCGARNFNLAHAWLLQNYSIYKVRQHLVNTVGLTCLYELRLQCELTLQTHLIGTSQPNHVHKVLLDLVHVFLADDRDCGAER